MNRIDARFEQLKREGRKGLVGYLTAGDPDAATSERTIIEAVAAGLDVLELGMPFSDATADGPVIQEASQRSLAAGMSVVRLLELIRRLRAASDVPIVVFGYANPFFRYGLERFAAAAQEAGADGMLVVDMPFEESKELREALERRGLHFIRLIAPTTPSERVSRLVEGAGGFVYYIMVRGVTGARTEVAVDLGEHVAKLRALTPVPLAVGFGVGSGEQAALAAASADAVVVGSALVKAAHEGRAAACVRELRRGLDERNQRR